MKNILSQYIKSGERIAELYHGEHDDILRMLSELVGPSGQVYGIDNMNPYTKFQHMRALQNVQNIKLLDNTIPPMPAEASDLDAIVIREFDYIYDNVPVPNSKLRTYVENEQKNQIIQTAIKPKGHLVIVLGETEREYPQYTARYEKTIGAWNCFKKVYDGGPLMIFQKS